MRVNAIVTTAVVSFWLCSPVQANKYGSVEPIANPAVIDTSALRDQPLPVREAFARRLLQCGIVDRVVQALSATKAITTINDLNTHVSVGAGGFAGATNPSYVFTVIDAGPNAASTDDVKVLTDSLGYVMSQASAFLLDSDDTSSFDFPASYVVLNFATPPPLAASAALFEKVGRIDRELFATDTSGYTQYGRAYLSLQSAVSPERFIDGYVRAAAAFGVEYTPVINGRRRSSREGPLSRETTGRPVRAARSTWRGFPQAAIVRSRAFARSICVSPAKCSAGSSTTAARSPTWPRSTATDAPRVSRAESFGDGQRPGGPLSGVRRGLNSFTGL